MVSKFILGLRPIERYYVSGRLPGEISVDLSARSCTGGALAMQGRRSGFFNQRSEGTISTPPSKVSFSGTRPFIGGGEHVSLVYGEGDASGRLRIPRTWGIVSYNSRARLWLSSDASRSFEIWKPSVRFHETVGWFRPHEGEVVVYRLFAQNRDDKMFKDSLAFPQMRDGDALVLLASLLYMCIRPELVLDAD